MKLIPIVNLEDKILGVPKPDIAAILMIFMFVGAGRSIVNYSYIVEFVVFVLFVVYLLVKRNLEAKEQSLFSVLWSNSRVPNQVAGTFRLRRFLGVRRDVR